jgi:DNA invertase Pin-like site-specific DNA recombinase
MKAAHKGVCNRIPRVDGERGGYVRVSTEEQGMSGAGLEAQRAAILAEAKRRGWEIVVERAASARFGPVL